MSSQNHHKGPLRSLRRMLSLDRIFPSSHDQEEEEEAGGYRSKPQYEEEKGVRELVRASTAKHDARRRQSWTREARGGGGEAVGGGGGVDEARAKLLRLKSYPPVVSNHAAHEKKVHLAEGAASHNDGGVANRHNMNEASTGKARRAHPSLPPLSLPLQSPHTGTARAPPTPAAAPASHTPSSEKRIDELLECAVCLERLNDPRTLPCDHTFCLNCLKIQVSSPLGAVDGSAGVIKCPTCRRDAAIPHSGGIASFPTNIYLQSLLQVLADRGTASSPTTTPQTPLPSTNGCLKCGKSGHPHLYICGHCQQVLCKECLPGHLKEMKIEMLDIQEKIQGVTLRLEEAEKELSARFEQLRSQVEAEREQRVARVAEDSRRLLDRVGALEAKRQQDGRELRQRLKGALANCSVDAFENTASESKVEMFLNVRREASGLLTEASRWSERARSPLTFDRTNFRVLDPEDEEDEEEANGEGGDEEDDEDGEDGEEDTVGDSGKREQARKAAAAARVAARRGRGGGEAETAARREGEPGARRRSAARPLPSTHDELSLYYRSRSMSSPRWQWGGNRGHGGSAGELYRPACLGVAPWGDGGELYVAASDGGRVSVFARRSGSGWKYSRMLAAPPDKERMLCPFGVAFSEARGEVYVTDKWCHCIHVYDTEGTWLRRLSKSGRAPGSLSSPEGIAASDRHIFVADTGNDRVQVLDASSGTFVTFVGSDVSSFKREPDVAEPSPGSGYLAQPSSVALSVDHSKLVVCDSGHNRIKIFDTSGLESGDYNVPHKPTCVFGSLGSQKGQLRSARGVAIDRMGFVVVADSGNSRVQIFRPNGTLVRAFGSKGKEAGQFGYPTGVHVGPLYELFVSDSTNHSVSVF